MPATTAVRLPVAFASGEPPAEEQRRRLYDPEWLGTHVAGWREAVLLHDPEGVGAAIKDEAHAWTWERVSDRVDEWVADSVTGFTEEVQKLVTSLARGQTTMAAVQRSVLALRLARTLALHHRILYGSENRLWAASLRRSGRPGAMRKRRRSESAARASRTVPTLLSSCSRSRLTR